MRSRGCCLKSKRCTKLVNTLLQRKRKRKRNLKTLNSIRGLKVTSEPIAAVSVAEAEATVNVEAASLVNVEAALSVVSGNMTVNVNLTVNGNLTVKRNLTVSTAALSVVSGNLMVSTAALSEVIVNLMVRDRASLIRAKTEMKRRKS